MKRSESPSPVNQNKEKTNAQTQMFNLQHSLRKINEEARLNSKENQHNYVPKLGSKDRLNDSTSNSQEFDLKGGVNQGSKEELDFPSDDETLIEVNRQGKDDSTSKKNSVSFQFQSFENPKLSLQSGSYRHSSSEDLTNSQPRARRRNSLERDICFGVATAQNMQGSKMEDAYKVIPFTESLAIPNQPNSPKLQSDSNTFIQSDDESGRPEKKRKTMHSSENSVSESPKMTSFHSDITNYAFFAVYDGHGGPQAAEFARSHLHSNIVHHPLFKSNTEEAIRAGFLTTEKEFTDSILTTNRSIHGVGTTAVIAILFAESNQTTLYIAHVGDSEAILCRAGKIIELSAPHTLKNPAERKRVESVGGRIIDNRLAHPIWNPHLINIAVTRAFGDLYFKQVEYTEGKPSGLIAEPEITKIVLTTEDEFVLLASDGFWDVISKQRACEFIRSQAHDYDVNMTCKGLTDLALREKTLDDTTVLLIKLKSGLSGLSFTTCTSSTNKIS